MNRRIAITAAAVVVLASLGLAARAQPAAAPITPQQTTPSPTTTVPAQYLPIIQRVPNTPTPTNTPTASPGPSPTPTLTASPGPSPTPTLTASPGPSPTPTATPTIGPSPTPTLPPPSFDECRPDPNAANAPNYPVKIVTVFKTTNPEVVRLQNVSNNPVDLLDWNMCSFNTQQPHDDIDGVLAPGEVRDFPYTGSVTGGIWDDAVPNDGALYNASGRPVSFWNE